MDTVKNAPPDQATLSDHVYSDLLRLIISGEIADGEVISALAVSKRLGVSRSPAHNAILRLESDGLVQIGSDRQAHVVSVTRERVYEIYEMRRILEVAAVDRASGRMTLADTQPLRAMLRRIPVLPEADQVRAWSESDESFHRAIAEASGLASLASDIARYRLLHRAMNQSLIPEGKLPQAIAEHTAILDAIEARDPAAAGEAMAAHLESWQRYFIEQVESYQ